MKILKCLLDKKTLTMGKEEALINKSGDVRNVCVLSSPTLIIVNDVDGDTLRKFDDLIVDRGVKNKNVPLSRPLLGQKNIPLISGGFSTTKQLKRSVRTVLENAEKKNERQMYFVSVKNEIFQALWQGAPLLNGQYDTQPSSSFVIGKKYSTQMLLDTIPSVEEPQELSKRFIGDSPDTKLVRQLILLASRKENTVLILGDTGTGKEVVARAIHDFSQNRSNERFVPVNCGAISRELFESELFGHEKGSFTGADRDKPGLWKIADKGTLFLDEIGDLSLEHQVKLLRALESGKIRPVGAKEEIKVNARIIAATNRDLYFMVKSGHFREDLYYRLREFQIRTPSLNDHLSDLPALANFFWKHVTHDEHVELDHEIITGLSNVKWSGNARELKMVLATLYSLFGTKDLRPNYLSAVFMLQGQINTAGQESAFSTRSVDPNEMASLNHLRKVDDVLNILDITIQNLPSASQWSRGENDMLETFHYRMSELDALCGKPMLFYSEPLFSEFHKLLGKMAYFMGVLDQNTSKAEEYLKKDIAPSVTQVRSHISKVIKDLRANV